MSIVGYYFDTIETMRVNLEKLNNCAIISEIDQCEV